MANRPHLQSRLRFTTDADPRYCAKAFCRAARLKRPTHTVTIGDQVFRVCSSCARPYVGMHGAKVERIAKEVA